jgi:hypothetical protein
MTALVGSRVAGEHYHPALVERFAVLEGELTVKWGGQTSKLRQGESVVIQAGVWHDWWNAADRDARVRVEMTPGERLAHLLETFFGLARLGHTDLWRAGSDCALARLSRDLPAALPHCARATSGTLI